MENVRILIIEDNPVDILCLKDALEESKTTNFVISHVETLAEGKESLANADFHVVALDLGLPDSQGLETFLRIRNSAPTTSIVVLSGLDDEILAREAVRKGAQDYLLKGKYDGHSLSRSITYAIERKRAQEEIRRLNEDLEKRIKERTAQLTMANEKLLSEITERKQTEEALRESEEKYRRLHETMMDAFVSVDMTGRVQETNQAYRAMLGYSEDELRNLTYKHLTPEPWHTFESSIVEGQVLVKGYSDVYCKEYRRKDGTIFPVELRTFLVKNAAGQAFAMWAIVRDISERRLAEETIAGERSKFKSILDHMMDGVYIVNSQYEIEYVNPALLSERGELAGRKCYEYLVGRTEPCVWCRNQEVLAGDSIVWERTSGLTGKTYDIFETPIKNQDGSISVLLILHDITERKSLEQQFLQAQKMEAIGTLAGGVAHDFNNVLQVALGYSEILLDDEELPRRCRDDLQKINESAQRGADLVQRLLTFGRKTEIKPEPLDLNRRIAELRKMLERTLPKMVEIQLLQNVKLAKINADKTQIDQVLMNLAVNARDAMPDGGKLLFETSNITLDEEYARAHLEAKPGPHVLLTVTDTGCGMDEGALEHIFEPFYTTKGVGEGTGLGLAMVHGIVKQHEGHIICHSEPGKGTTFKIYFPALISEEREEETIERPMPRGGSETILLVDDEEFIRDLGSRILTKAGYTVITASNGKEALKVYGQQGSDIDLVLLDLMMPEMGGKQCLEGLLSFNRSVNVVIASGYSASGPTKEALQAGARGFVNKPYEMRQMLEVVRGALDSE
jgi:two-component system, cell cycle sensor histidine kinase and response regulator CckA